jgi:hypothetical protein
MVELYRQGKSLIRAPDRSLAIQLAEPYGRKAGDIGEEN